MVKGFISITSVPMLPGCVDAPLTNFQNAFQTLKRSSPSTFSPDFTSLPAPCHSLAQSFTLLPLSASPLTCCPNLKAKHQPWETQLSTFHVLICRPLNTSREWPFLPFIPNCLKFPGLYNLLHIIPPTSGPFLFPYSLLLLLLSQYLFKNTTSKKQFFTLFHLNVVLLSFKLSCA